MIGMGGGVKDTAAGADKGMGTGIGFSLVR